MRSLRTLIIASMIIAMVSVIDCGKFLNRFVLHYEPLSYEPISTNHTQARRKRSLEQGHERVLLTFHAHSRRFRLSLINDRSAFSDEFVIITSAGPVKANLDHLYSGYLIGVPESRVVGSILDGVFHGRIETPGEEFYAEPASRYFKGDHGFHSIIYAGSDVVLQSGCGLHGATETSMNELRRQYGHRNGTTLLRSKRSILELVPSQDSSVLGRMPGVGVDFHARSLWMTGSPVNEKRQQKVKRVCNLEINIDHTLYNAVLADSHLDHGKTQETLIAMLTSHVTAASDMFRNTDFLGIADISFEIQSVLINDSESCDADKRASNPFCASDLDSAHMLHELSKINHDDFCLSYLWTYRDFVGGTLGLAYKAEPNGFPGTAGGICDKFQSGSSLHSSSSFLGKLSLNTGIVTFLNQNSRVPERITHITFTHELGHNFGSPHDFPPECVPGSIVGNYIMYESATHGNLPNNRKFSPCSVRNVSLVLHQLFSGEGPRPNCFQEPRGPYCGNFIREEGEECDCGFTSSECEKSCCYAREHGEVNHRACTLKPGASCSPSNGACCSKNCTVRKNTFVCREDDDCSFEAICDGLTSDCPPSAPKPNGTLCNHGTQMCEDGHCKRSICAKYNLNECFLTGSYRTPDEMCLIACSEPGPPSECKEACEFELMKELCGRRMEPGAACDDMRGYCDVFRKCRRIDTQGPLSMLHDLVFGHMGLRNVLVRYWYITIVLIALGGVLMMLLIRVCAVHTPSSNPNLQRSRKVGESLKDPVSILKELVLLSSLTPKTVVHRA